jgi:hypothetical protein
MESDERIVGDEAHTRTRPRSCLFTVRLWKEDIAGGTEYRGNVRDITSGGFRNFRDWSELAAFMCARLEANERARAGLSEEGL